MHSRSSAHRPTLSSVEQWILVWESAGLDLLWSSHEKLYSSRMELELLEFRLVMEGTSISSEQNYLIRPSLQPSTMNLRIWIDFYIDRLTDFLLFFRPAATHLIINGYLTMAVWLVQCSPIQLRYSDPIGGSDASRSSMFPFPFTRRFHSRNHFSDFCCSPVNQFGSNDPNLCRLYYRLHPPSTCSGYRPIALRTSNTSLSISFFINVGSRIESGWSPHLYCWWWKIHVQCPRYFRISSNNWKGQGRGEQ